MSSVPAVSSRLPMGPPALPRLGRSKLGAAGRLTPDSEALASSEDEHELTQSTHSLGSNPPLPTSQAPRRKSFLSEIQSGGLRKMSFTGISVPSQGSQPSTPSETQHNPWSFGTSLGRVTSNGSTSARTGAAAWNEPRRDSLPLQSNVFTSSPGLTYAENKVGSSIGIKDDMDATIPFSIPLFPTPKTYRSQSYSVGQLENEVAQITPPAPTRSWQNPAATVKHRPARPSTLREENEPSIPENVYEIVDDEESPAGSEQGVRLGSIVSKQDHFADIANHPFFAQSSQDNLRSKPRGSSNLSLSAARDVTQHLREVQNLSGHADVEHAVEDDVEQYGLGARLPRRFSEFGGNSTDDHKRGQWHTSLGFGHLEEIPQSRRHSFAEMPTRRGSIASPPASYGGVPALHNNIGMGYGNQSGAVNSGGAREHELYRQPTSDMQASMEMADADSRAYAANYFSGIAPAMRSSMEASSGHADKEYYMSNSSRNGPDNNYYPRPPNASPPLYIVAFKCMRADVFYIEEGTGLQVKVGDIVLVEADRGQDLGTVTHCKVNWAQAKTLKEEAAEEHYRWLMMFSSHNQSISSDTVNPNGMMAAAGNQHDASGAKPPPGLASGMHNAAHPYEIKPKMIKRIAQPHEVSTLRDKEGNEAKAKRTCQQKVRDHKLKMEILDAEFQTDWKKLTFYFFAESYVNFNPLITDLFKIYKTRIWMSAVNPAAFTSPPSQLPSAIGPGAMSSHDIPADNESSQRHATAASPFSANGGPYGHGQPQYPNAYSRPHNHGRGGFGTDSPAFASYGSPAASGQARAEANPQQGSFDPYMNYGYSQSGQSGSAPFFMPGRNPASPSAYDFRPESSHSTSFNPNAVPYGPPGTIPSVDSFANMGPGTSGYGGFGAMTAFNGPPSQAFQDGKFGRTASPSVQQTNNIGLNTASSFNINAPRFQPIRESASPPTHFGAFPYSSNITDRMSLMAQQMSTMNVEESQ